jgi:hypothetical protein
VTGVVAGAMFYEEQPETTKGKVMKYGFVALSVCIVVSLVAACYAITGQFYQDLNVAIDSLC